MLQKHSNKTIATFYLILFSLQYVLVEGNGVSMIKFVAMLFCPVIILIHSPKITPAMFWGGLYYLCIVLLASLHPESFRISTLIYLFALLSMFIMYYNLIYIEHALNNENFIKIIKGILYAYSIVIIVQQCFKMVGIVPFTLINLNYYDSRTLLCVNGLAIEQSHSARIMTILFLALLRMLEIKHNSKKLSFSTVYSELKLLFFLFLWAMLTMGSATAYVGIIILACYFLKNKYIYYIIPIVCTIFLIGPYIDFGPINRVINLTSSFVTFDTQQMIQSEGSGATRVFALTNTLTHLDIFDINSWVGNGVDSSVSKGFLSDDSQYISIITDYGLISYIVGLIFIFKCSIKNIFSFETFIFIFLFGAGLNNVYYIWFAMMIFTTVKYFQTFENKEQSI